MAKSCPMQGKSALDMMLELGESIVSVKDNIKVGKELARVRGQDGKLIPLHENREGWVQNYRYYFDGFNAKTRGMPIKKFFSALGNIQGETLYTKNQGKVLGRMFEVEQLTKRIPRVFGNLNEAQQKVLTEFLTDAHIDRAKRRYTTKKMDVGFLGSKERIDIDQLVWLPEDEATLSIFTESQRELAKEAKQKIMEVGQIAAELGVIDYDKWRANRGRYLHNVYGAYIEDTFSGAGKRPSFLDWAKTKKLSDPKWDHYKESVLVEIKDPALVLSETIGLVGRDTALLTMFRNIRHLSRDALLRKTLGPDDAPLLWTFDDPLSTKESSINLIAEGRKDLADLVGNDTVSIAAIDDMLSKAQRASATTGRPLDPVVMELASFRDALVQDRVEHIIGIINTVWKSQMKPGADITMFGSRETGYNLQAINEFLIGQGYKQAPNSIRWGALAGTYIKKEIYEDLSRTFAIFDDENANKWFGRGGYLEQITSEWKKMKVPFNFPSWIRNFISTFIAMDMSTDTPSWKLMGMVVDHAENILDREILGKTNVEENLFITEAKKRGKFSTTFSAQEIRFNRSRWIQARKKLEAAKREVDKYDGVRKAWWMLSTGYWNISETVGDIYSSIEGGFKSVVMEDYVRNWIKANGSNYNVSTLDQFVALRDGQADQASLYETVMDAAAVKADKWILDYSKVPSWLEYIRRMPLGAPFITWTYKMFPRTVEGMVKYPHKVAPYIMVPIVLQQWAMAAFDWDDDDVEELKKSLPDWLSSQSSMAIMPWKHEGKAVFVPMGYWYPWAAYIDPVLKAAGGFEKQPPGIGNALEKTGGLISDFGLLGGPVPSLLFDLVMNNKDNFTGQPIMDPEAPAATQINQLGLYLGNLALPTWLGSQGMTGHILDNFGIKFPIISKGEEFDRWGQDKEGIGQALARGVGVSSVNVDVERSRQQKLRILRGNVSRAKAELTKVRKDMSLRGERRAEELARRTAVVKFHQNRLRSWLND